MTLLCELAKKYGTDKFPSYTSFYHLLLAPRRQVVKSMLEIGIGSVAAMSHVPNYKPGASLRMWAEYFPNANVLGVDYDPTTMMEADRIHTQLLDQNSRSQLISLARDNSFDFIIDDGSHAENHQLQTLELLFPCLTPGGLYIIEDANRPEVLSDQISMDNSIVWCHPTDDKKHVGRLLVIGKEE
jgi:trans-aconitate methyltransferase